jgi:hypothetical protein
VFTPIAVFEELRFILENYIILLLLFFPTAERRSHFWWRFPIVSVLTIASTFGYFGVVYGTDNATDLSTNGLMFSYICWYVFLAFVCLGAILFCFKVSLTELFFKGCIGYAAQHFEYSFINETIARGVHPQFRTDPSQLWMYILLSIFTCALWYWLLYRLFSRILRKYSGDIFPRKPGFTIAFFVFFLIVIATSFTFQLLFQNNDVHQNSGYNYAASTMEAFVCLLLLFMFYFMLQVGQLNQEKAIYDQLLHEKEKQYQREKENVDIINRKCHDMKHQLAALKTMSPEERDQSIDEVSKAILIYDSAVKTQNEALNTILNEKSLYCQDHGITLSCVIDDSKLDCFSTLELYTLLGNAIDNAIESVMKITEKDKRTISLVISTKKTFLTIQINNYYSGKVEMENGLPVTSKADKDYHGFGVRSIAEIVRKHLGSLVIRTDSGIFTLEIVIPLEKK